MPCSGGCGGGGIQVPFPGGESRRAESMEYRVLLPSGEYSDPQPSLEAAFELAAQTGGQARSMAKIDR